MHWLGELAVKHGKEQFRVRKGAIGPNVKVLCEEVLPLANLLAASDLYDWTARLSAPGDMPDAWARSAANPAQKPIQIVCAFDGAKFAEQMRHLNDLGFTRVEAASGAEIEDMHAALVELAIEKKKAKRYPADYWLVVAIDDVVIQVQDMPGLQRRAAEAAACSGFERVYLVGMTERSTGIRLA